MEKNENVDKTFFVLLLGDDNVGKTNILFNYINEEINYGNNSIIGIEGNEKVIEINNEKILLNLIDSAGQERAKGVTKIIYKKRDAFIIFFNYSIYESFNSIIYWINNIIEYSDYQDIWPPILIVGIKNDDDDNIETENMNLDSIKQKMKENKLNFNDKNVNKIKFINCNYKKLNEINNIFKTILDDILENKSERENIEERAPSFCLQNIKENKKQKCCK